MSDDRLDQLRAFLVAQLDTGDQWAAAMDPDFPPALAALHGEVFEAYRSGDVEWILEHADPEIVIV